MYESATQLIWPQLVNFIPMVIQKLAELSKHQINEKRPHFIFGKETIFWAAAYPTDISQKQISTSSRQCPQILRSSQAHPVQRMPPQGWTPRRQLFKASFGVVILGTLTHYCYVKHIQTNSERRTNEFFVAFERRKSNICNRMQVILQ